MTIRVLVCPHTHTDTHTSTDTPTDTHTNAFYMDSSDTDTDTDTDADADTDTDTNIDTNERDVSLLMTHLRVSRTQALEALSASNGVEVSAAEQLTAHGIIPIEETWRMTDESNGNTFDYTWSLLAGM